MGIVAWVKSSGFGDGGELWLDFGVAASSIVNVSCGISSCCCCYCYYWTYWCCVESVRNGRAAGDGGDLEEELDEGSVEGCGLRVMGLDIKATHKKTPFCLSRRQTRIYLGYSPVNHLDIHPP